MITKAAEVAPVLQEKTDPPLAVRVVELPAQSEVFPVMAAVMLLFTEIVAVAVAEQLPAVTNTV